MLRLGKEKLKSFLGIENADLTLSGRTGIPIREIERLRSSKSVNDRSVIFGKAIYISDPFWHLHSLNEIFVADTYKFNTEKKNPLIIDCGANIGLSVIYFKKLFPGSEIIAFEADPYIAGLLQKNITALELEKVSVCNKAVWVDEGIIEFAASGALGGTMLLEKATDKKTIRAIPSIRLSNYLDKEVDFLKIDIEGAEFEVLKDCSGKLQNVNGVFVEYHSSPGKKQDLAALLSILENSGFRVYIKEAWNNLPVPFMFGNYKPFWDLQLNIFGYRP